MSWRLERIGEQVRGELARLLRDEVSDPRIGLVTLTRVDVAADLSTASVFWSRLVAGSDPDARDADAGDTTAGSETAGGAEDADVEAIQEVARGLESAAGFLRRRLASELSLRKTPELRFRHDPSIAAGSATLSLIRELNEEREQREAREAPAGEPADAPEERD